MKKTIGNASVLFLSTVFLSATAVNASDDQGMPMLDLSEANRSLSPTSASSAAVDNNRMPLFSEDSSQLYEATKRLRTCIHN